ncbi:MAG: asparagine synthase-related protein [Thiobacillus sp.]
MDGIFGWLGDQVAHQALLDAQHSAAHIPPENQSHAHSSQLLGVAASSRFGKASIHVESGLAVALHGRPLFNDDALAQMARDHSPAAAAALGWQRVGTQLPTLMSGNFTIAVLEPLKKQAFLAIDRMGTERLCVAHAGTQLVFGASAKSVACHPDIGQTLDTQAIYEYLYFHMIPAPRTIYRGISKLLPGEFLQLQNGTLTRGFYWQPDYSPLKEPDFAATRDHFRTLLNQSVNDAAGELPGAAFLSGGTDSSSVVGTLSALRDTPVKTFSIGFDAAGFDEMEYARCAVERYRADSHEYYLTPQDIVSTIPVIAQEYDEPFGNASAVPTYLCAQQGHAAGLNRMLAGDGGDELFGGNARYAKQKAFELYFTLPALLRRGLIEPIAHLPILSAHLPLRKLTSYVDQANIGLPLRLESYNFLHRTPLTEIFTPDFIDAVTPALTDRALSAVYDSAQSDHYVNRLMHLDLKFTLADNDLRKVNTMTEAAGIEVRYPLLDDRLVAFANQLPVDYKVRGQRLRWFFKEALRDLLPEKIITKSKHGFGLPFGVWSTQHAPLGEMVGDSLADLGKRGWIKPGYLDQLRRELHGPHASYYGVMVWVAMMLERWMQADEA